MKTCVLPFRRRNAFEWRMRSRSRWNGVRRRQSSSARLRPAVSYERTARAESHASSCSRMRASKASATRPASSGIVVRAYSVERSDGALEQGSPDDRALAAERGRRVEIRLARDAAGGEQREPRSIADETKQLEVRAAERAVSI